MDEIGQPGQLARRGDQRVQLIFCQYLVDALLPREFQVILQCILVFLAVEVAFRLGADKEFLAEVMHFFGAVLLVEGDHVGQ